VRAILILATLALLASDVALDLDFFASPTNRTAPLLASAAVRNLLMLAAAGALLVQSRLAAWLVGAVALAGLVRRAAYLLPLQWDDSTWLLVHSGADLLFRLVLIGYVVDRLRQTDS
jgi:hypothetical protein